MPPSSKMRHRRRFQPFPLPLAGRAENTLYGAANGLNHAWSWRHCCGASAAFIGWSTSSLRDEAAELRSTIAALKRNVAEEQKTLQKLVGKTWRLELVKWDDERGIILPKGVKFVRSGQIKDGREAIVIKP